MPKISTQAFSEAFQSIPGEKIAAEALMGGVAGMGLNAGVNIATGDQGGYMGSAMLGAGLGGVARTGMKMMNKEHVLDNVGNSVMNATRRSDDSVIPASEVRTANNTSMSVNMADKAVTMLTNNNQRRAIEGNVRNSIKANSVDTMNMHPDLRDSIMRGQSESGILPTDIFTPVPPNRNVGLV